MKKSPFWLFIFIFIHVITCRDNNNDEIFDDNLKNWKHSFNLLCHFLEQISFQGSVFVKGGSLSKLNKINSDAESQIALLVWHMFTLTPLLLDKLLTVYYNIIATDRCIMAWKGNLVGMALFNRNLWCSILVTGGNYCLSPWLLQTHHPQLQPITYHHHAQPITNHYQHYHPPPPTTNY